VEALELLGSAIPHRNATVRERGSHPGTAPLPQGPAYESVVMLSGGSTWMPCQPDREPCPGVGKPAPPLWVDRPGVGRCPVCGQPYSRNPGTGTMRYHTRRRKQPGTGESSLATK